MRGKIIKGIAGFYYVHDGKDHVYQCRAKGIFRNRNIKPLVGDDVEFTVLDEEEGNIAEILPRKNELIRPAAANVDQAVVLFAVADPDPNLNLLDRFLVTMKAQNLPVIVCFNKIDLCEENTVKEYRDIYEKAGYQVRFLSASQGTGYESFRELLKGKTTVFAGPSGVGKSSWTNLIQPEAGMETGKIRFERASYNPSLPAFLCGRGYVSDGYAGIQLSLFGKYGSGRTQKLFSGIRTIRRSMPVSGLCPCRGKGMWSEGSLRERCSQQEPL